MGPWLLDSGSARFIGLGVPYGALIGLLVYIVVQSALFFEAETRPFSLSGMPTLLMGLLVAVLAHFVEIQVGIAIASTRTHFWVYAAMLVAVGFFMARRSAEEGAAIATGPEPVKAAPEPRPASEPARGRGAQPRRGRVQPSRSVALAERPAVQGFRVQEAQSGAAQMAAYGLVIGVVMMTMLFCFWTRNFNIATGNFSILWLFIGTWPVATVIGLAAMRDRPGENAGDWVMGLVVYVVASLGVPVVFALVYSPFLHAGVTVQGAAAVLQIAGQINWLLKSFYLVGFLVMLLLGFALYRATPTAAAAARVPWQDRNWWLYPILVVAVLWAAFMLECAADHGRHGLQAGAALRRPAGLRPQPAPVRAHPRRWPPARTSITCSWAALIWRRRSDSPMPPRGTSTWLPAGMR